MRHSASAAAALAIAAAAAALGVATRRRRAREAAAAEEEVLLIIIKGLCKATYYAVSDAQGLRFSERGLASVARQRGLVAATTTLARAKALVAWLESRHTPLETCAPKRARLRHALVRGALDGATLRAKFDAMQAAYAQQPLDYGQHSRYGNKWRISCYLVVLERWKPKIQPHRPMVDCMDDVMRACVALFEAWYAAHAQPAKASVMNCFVTRYRPHADEDQLEKHVDGANVDGSVILALPTDDPFDGGALKVWDDRPKREFHYPDMRPGDAILLDARVWHQALPITAGTRYAMVLFLKLHKQKQHDKEHSV
ncbi:hypothetical protein CTAYLR_007224 [Chrysophaeum taylorii]|uniref:Fe2OG dioxygenase domain-containing protein n=1 Tax=Chrysophaeum taylorii TaxID=2483200 RepID=A0AAD7XK53_9STRA|nr:hypothetical protein CTAYLR_007224 [Chrysophaeum taylorii]